MNEKKHFSEEQKKVLNDFCLEIIKNSYKCAHCALNHGGYCFLVMNVLKMILAIGRMNNKIKVNFDLYFPIK